MMRFAPSPTGEMQTGTLRLALVNYLVAKQRNIPFTVRMDDTDKAAVIEGKDTEIMQVLEKFAVIHDRVFHQSEHLHMHQILAIRLLEERKAFVCTCAEESEGGLPYSGKCMAMDKTDYRRLKESGEPFVIRIKKPGHPILIRDTVQGERTVSPDEVDSFILLRADATPTRDFAAACDDMLSGTDCVIEDEAALTHTAKQIHIKQMLGYGEKTEYAHLPLLRNSKGAPFSEHDAGFTLVTLFAEGFIPDAIINYLLRISMPHAPQEIFYFSDALVWFSLEETGQASHRFEMEALRRTNRAHLRMMDDKRLSSLFGFADADIGRLAKLYLDGGAATINEVAAKIRPVLAPKPFEGAWAKQMRQIQQVLADAPMFETYEALETYVTQETALDGEKLQTPLRLLLTGAQQGPELEDIYPTIRSYLLEVIS